jgi:DNA invertase Pin-like site-specific DNA recombinase
MSDKIKPHNIERKAIVYVRQFSAFQVQNNLESQRLQYAMRDRLRSLGWRDIEVIDEDLGRSASGTVTRVGFERMVAEVCLGDVGAVAAREVSRFALNSREWQKLVEVCRVVDTLLIDQEMVYTHSSRPQLYKMAGRCRPQGKWPPHRPDGGHRWLAESVLSSFFSTTP